MKKDIVYKFDHIGVPTKNPQEGEFYYDQDKNVYLYNGSNWEPLKETDRI